ncbi:MAG TPA: hypothetical protein VFZ58_03215 [Candidatus Saccharimonadales bacterium]
MEEHAEGSRDSFFEALSARLLQAQRALGRACQPAFLEVIEAELAAGQYSEADKQNYRELGVRFLEASYSDTAIVRNSGVEPHSDATEADDSHGNPSEETRGSHGMLPL